MTFLIHPEHGATNVSPSEVEALEKNGWKPATLDEWYVMSGKPHLCNGTIEQEDPADVLEDVREAIQELGKPRRKPGRPPKAKQ